jgi:hypothetical protein
MTTKYYSASTNHQKQALFEHGPYIADLLIGKMEPTKMSPTDLLNRYRDEQSPRSGEKFTEWALIHFGYISLKNIGNPQAVQEELIGHLVTRYMPKYDTAFELQTYFESHPRVDGLATDAGLLRMDLDNAAVTGLDPIKINNVATFCSSMVVNSPELITA